MAGVHQRARVELNRIRRRRVLCAHLRTVDEEPDARNADVVGGRCRERHRARQQRAVERRGQRDDRRGRVRDYPDRDSYVVLDLVSAQRAIIDTDLVDQAGKVFTPYGVATDLQRVGARRDRLRDRPRTDFNPVDVHAQHRAVERGGEMSPHVERQAARTGHGNL